MANSHLVFTSSAHPQTLTFTNMQTAPKPALSHAVGAYHWPFWGYFGLF
jgi:hypothetical protein